MSQGLQTIDSGRFYFYIFTSFPFSNKLYSSGSQISFRKLRKFSAITIHFRYFAATSAQLKSTAHSYEIHYYALYYEAITHYFGKEVSFNENSKLLINPKISIEIEIMKYITRIYI